MKEKFYITTAIDYVNAAPHIGHAFEKVLADIIARWNRLNNKEVFFLTGTDENAQKNLTAAKISNIPIEKFIEQNTKKFLELCDELEISYDRFIRTTEKEHMKKTQEIFTLAYQNGDIYKGNYEGYYCEGCEAFVTEKDLVNGKCLEHEVEPSFRSEETYFFKLSKYKKQIIDFIEDYVIPEQRKNEIIFRLKSEDLKDLSVTRYNVDWGIECPIDKKHKIYVWFDALINYVTGGKNYWPADLHVVGKGINWFHSVIWPAMLFSVKYPMPKKLLVHGYLNVGGKKMSKSKGNVLSPTNLIKRFGKDSVRYSLSRCSVFDDSDFSEEIVLARHNNELANKLGNLILRATTLMEKYGLAKSEKKDLDSKELVRKVSNYFDNYEIDKALAEIFSFIDKCNEFIQERKPWREDVKEKEKILYILANAIKDFTILLSPFMPTTCKNIAKTFNFEISMKELGSGLKISKIKKSNVLFEKI